MRVAFDIAAVETGGAERQMLEVACGLQDRGHEVLLLANKVAVDYPEYLARLLVREFHRGNRWDLRLVGDIAKALRRFDTDVCVCVSFNASLYGRLGALPLRCSVVVAEHSTLAHPSKVAVASNVLLRATTDQVIACARAQVPYLVHAGHQSRKITVVPNGVDTARFKRDEEGAADVRKELGLSPDAPIVTLVAAHRPEKGHRRFVRLLEGLHGSGVGAAGLMVGGGPDLEQTRRLVQDSPVAPFLHLLGPRVDMPAVYSASDVVILVSDVETFPLCFLEAQACETPVVGLDTGGVRETLEDGVTGHAVPCEDPAGMVAIVAGLLTDRDRRREMGRAGRAFVERSLSREAMIEGYERALLEAVAARKRAHARD